MTTPGWYCMRCGAEEYQVTCWSGSLQTRRCCHCSGVTYATVNDDTAEPVLPPDTVEYHPATVGGARCPQCGCFPCRVRVTKGSVGKHRTRYHACTECGWSGKSTETL